MAVRYLVPICAAFLLLPSFVIVQGGSVEVTISANGERLLAHPGTDYILEWSSSNAASCSMSYEGGGQQSSYRIAPNVSSSRRSADTGWYTLKCIGRNGQSVSKTVIVAQMPGSWPAAPSAAETVDEKIAPFIVAAGARAVRWLQGDTLGEFLYGSDAHTYLHRIDQAATGDPTGREEVSCTGIPRGGLAVILIAGQSNAANSARSDADGRYFSTARPVYNLNIGDGKCYVAKNPLLGSDAALDASGKPIGQSFALPLASALIDGGLYERVLLVPIAVSGTLIEQWIPSPPRTPGAAFFNRFLAAIDLLERTGLRPTFILWHQGEGNSGAPTALDLSSSLTPDLARATTLSWMRNLFHIVAALRDRGVTAPIFVAKATVCGHPKPSAHIRQAQASVVDPAWRILPGPDTDMIGQALRSDGCHFSHEGNLMHAQKWYESLRTYWAQVPHERQSVATGQPPHGAK
jgi:hypothetical protein